MNRALVILVLFLIAVAAGLGLWWRFAPPAANPLGRSPAVAPVDVAALAFDTPQLKQRFQLFDSTARELAAAGNGWKHREHAMGGNFVTAVWAQGAGFDNDCRLDHEPEHQVGIHKIEVDTIVVGDKAKSAAISLELMADKPEEWSVLCNYRDASEQGVTGAGWGATFFQWDEAKLKTLVPFRPYEQTTVKINLGPRYSYNIEATPVEVVSELPYEQDFLAYLKSPESLRDSFLAASEKLSKRVEETISSHTAKKRIFGAYKGDGRPPPFP